jgi:hypothetical protein
MDDGTSGDVTITRMPLRESGWVGYTSDAVYVQRTDDSDVKIDIANLTRITLQPLEWDLAVMSLLLVGVGAYVAVTRHVPVGVAFGVVGCWSSYRTYRNRYALRIYVTDRRKPLTIHPVDPVDCQQTLSDVAGLE